MHIKNNIVFVLITLFSLASSFMQAQPSKDSLQISLLTASPGSEVYEKYGHTALRVKELHGRYDVIFNYGLFSFDAPNFLYRFVKGETDYQLGATRPEYFIPEYVLRGSDLTEQILNLNQQEATDVLNALQENLKPENRVYRYSFIFDNCSTRPRDIVAANIPGGVEYKTENIDKTFRDLLHRQTGPRTWLTFGIDLTLGARTDGKPTFEQRMFLPEYLMDAYEDAYMAVPDSLGNKRKLVAETVLIVDSGNEFEIDKPEGIFDSPMIVFWVIFVIILAISVFEWQRGKVFAIIDTLIFTVAGLVGIVLYFLAFISVHPFVDKNFNCVWLQPLDLFAAVAVWVKSCKKVLYYYHFANFVILLILSVCALGGIISQQFNPAFYPVIGTIMTRSCLHMLIYYKAKV